MTNCAFLSNQMSWPHIRVHQLRARPRQQQVASPPVPMKVFSVALVAVLVAAISRDASAQFYQVRSLTPIGFGVARSGGQGENLIERPTSHVVGHHSINVLGTRGDRGKQWTLFTSTCIGVQSTRAGAVSLQVSFLKRALSLSRLQNQTNA